ncbi:hypothetical protein ASG29_02080 [Sphingomonas sp. Leaf412]|uniref:hypothetical protein n=1 Tax=Sphingomonas sp. Leaf412 TaxID=1736370 RepID=UPI0006F326F9|nr:hypothetical protein [Sphingomonas sp. Leaf412]KQT34955.1 hypothetical protein ASG29_02080 [Sphingomonas sp. Leaf412]
MSDAGYDERPRPRQRIGPVVVIATIAFLVGLGLMVFAIRNTPGWLSGMTPAEQQRPVAAAPAQATPAPAPTPAIDTVTLATREAALGAQLSALEARAATINADSAAAAARAARAEGILVAFAARRALDRGVGLGYLEEQVRQRFGATIPRETNTIIQAARAPVTIEDLRIGLDAAQPTLLAGDSDWWAGIGSELRNLVVIHRAGTPSPLPADRVARARRMLDAGNVEAALGEIARLPGAAQAQNWTAAAQRYVDAHRALDTLEAAAITGAVAQPAGAYR